MDVIKWGKFYLLKFKIYIKRESKDFIVILSFVILETSFAKSSLGNWSREGGQTYERIHSKNDV